MKTEQRRRLGIEPKVRSPRLEECVEPSLPRVVTSGVEVGSQKHREGAMTSRPVEERLTQQERVSPCAVRWWIQCHAGGLVGSESPTGRRGLESEHSPAPLRTTYLAVGGRRAPETESKCAPCILKAQ